MSTVGRRRSMRTMAIDRVWVVLFCFLMTDMMGQNGQNWDFWVELVVLGVFFCYSLLAVWCVFALIGSVCSIAWIGNVCIPMFR